MQYPNTCAQPRAALMIAFVKSTAAEYQSSFLARSLDAGAHCTNSDRYSGRRQRYRWLSGTILTGGVPNLIIVISFSLR